MRPKIAILGCGWLGLPLGKSLVENGFQVNGSTTSQSKIPLLDSAGIAPFLIALSESEITGNITGFLTDCKILIVDIPPKLRGNDAENFVAKITHLLPFVEKSTVEKVLFVSSVSVFSEDNDVVTESTKPNPGNESGKQLFETEALLRHNPNFKTTILRLGGLVGEDRNPIHFLSGKNAIENPHAPINLIHRKDVIGLIEAIIEKDLWGEIFHGVAPQHPSRERYYCKKAAEMNLPLPWFDHRKPSVGKTVSGEKTQNVLDYTFKVTMD